MSDKDISIDDLCSRMQLEEEEEGGLLIEGPELEEQSQDLRWCLVGRLLSERQVNFMAMKNTLASIWRPVKGVIIKELGPNLFLFQFFHELDILRVQTNGPWTFDNLLLITKRLQVGEQPTKAQLFHTDWLRSSKPTEVSDKYHESTDSYSHEDSKADYGAKNQEAVMHGKGKSVVSGAVSPLILDTDGGTVAPCNVLVISNLITEAGNSKVSKNDNKRPRTEEVNGPNKLNFGRMDNVAAESQECVKDGPSHTSGLNSMMGYQFTWERGRGSLNWVEERLNICFSTQNWFMNFPNCKVWNLEATMSDHSPIFLELGQQFRIKRVKKFRFENAWIREKDCRDVVVQGWNKGEPGNLRSRIEFCGAELYSWGDILKNSFNHRIKEAKKKMKEFRGGRDSSSICEFKKAQNQYNLLLAQKEDFWKQRAKLFWLKGGDANTRYFHTVASTRNRHNAISSLSTSNRVWLNWENGLGNHITGYFMEIFSSSMVQCDPIISCVKKKVTSTHNNVLLEDFTEVEIKEALFSMFPDKAPGPDGMNPAFYQKFWDITGPEVVSSCLNFLRTFNTGQLNVILREKSDNLDLAKQRVFSISFYNESQDRCNG
ncbi:hypothetical protein DH2020_024605 [Rehmannia glutinosa]|uniref:DUF4283 domain-containing protein n=1 Tax=Rehmannia glutinosa TaxID=99300 RepID=A0ABR0W4J9_REHGL